MNQKLRPLSAQAPADERIWSIDDNFDAVQAEVLRLQPDLLSLQECASASAAARLVEKYTFVGARAGHSDEAGFVHLYLKKPLRQLPLELPGLPGVGCSVKLRHAVVAVVALHLAAGEDAAATREKHLCRAVELAGAWDETVVVLGDLNLKDAELSELTRRPLRGFGAVRQVPMQEATYSGSSWFPQANRYSDEDGYATRQPQRFDRVLFRGDAFGYAYLAGRRQHFAGGKGFFLSDHFAVMALLDVDPEHGRRDQSETLAWHRRAALARLRDQASFLERRGNDEASRLGREEAGLMRQRADLN